MNLNELQPEWQRYASTTAAREKKSLEKLNMLLPPQPVIWFTNYSSLLRNAAVYASIIVLCGGC
ncbi:MAG: hypothetical protein WBA23_22295 [Tunicatimonas sp.]|uniref:hypothetical protein n=1 Tax=Tunicatimonas sp. TaxID=1940096 RepID=UPI003C75693B